MKVAILTSSLNGVASHHLKELLKNDSYEIAAVFYSQGLVVQKKKFYLKKIKKTFKIGFLGTLNGIRMRKWYNENTAAYLDIENLEGLCRNNKIPFHVVNSINNKVTEKILREAKVRVGISLGNGYIASRIFSIPELGMINIHHEQLPEFQNAQSVIWQLYEGSDKTAYTIHKIDKQIDTGAVIFSEQIPIIFKETLADTVAATYAALFEASAAGLVKVLSDFDHYYHSAVPQKTGSKYTTPNIFQFWRIYSNFKKLKEKSLANS